VQQTNAACVSLPVREDHQFRLARAGDARSFLHLVGGDIRDNLVEMLGVACVFRQRLIVRSVLIT
jgi:hypothetical protein